MTEPKKFQRGKHTYTRWGSKFKEVRVEGKKKAGPPAAETQLTIQTDANMETGVYSNFSMVHCSEDELFLDFCFVPPGHNKGKTRARIILPFHQLQPLARLLKQTADELAKAQVWKS